MQDIEQTKRIGNNNNNIEKHSDYTPFNNFDHWCGNFLVFHFSTPSFFSEIFTVLLLCGLLLSSVVFFLLNTADDA